VGFTTGEAVVWAEPVDGVPEFAVVEGLPEFAVVEGLPELAVVDAPPLVV